MGAGGGRVRGPAAKQHQLPHSRGRLSSFTLLADDLGDAGVQPALPLLERIAGHPAGNRALAETITGLDTRYPMCPDTDHPWLGRLAPDLPLTTRAGRTGLAELLASGRGLLLDLADGFPLRESAAGWADRVHIVEATCPDRPELLAVLLRPDGHTAWLRTTDHDHAGGLYQALQHWHGLPA